MKANPFTDTFLKRELSFMDVKAYEWSGISIEVKPLQGCIDEYLNKQFWANGPWVPILRVDGRLWMSITPMEIQSMWVPINMARGRVATAGLGLGYFPLRVAQERAVESVTVFEIDERLIRLFYDRYNKKRNFDKIKIVHGDVYKKINKMEYEFIFMDVYGEMFDDRIEEDLYHFLNILDYSPREYRFWCQELLLWEAMRFGKTPDMTTTEKAFFSYFMQSRKFNLAKRYWFDRNEVINILGMLEVL